DGARVRAPRRCWGRGGGSEPEDPPPLRGQLGWGPYEASTEFEPSVASGPPERGAIAGVRLPIAIAVLERGHRDGLGPEPVPLPADEPEERHPDLEPRRRGLEKASTDHERPCYPPAQG